MRVVVIDPEARTVRMRFFTSFGDAQRTLLNEPLAFVNLTDDHILVYQPFACSAKASFFFSRRLEQHYAGAAIVAGAAVDGAPINCGRGIERAVQKDILFLGDVEQAKRTIVSMAKFEAGTLRGAMTTH